MHATLTIPARWPASRKADFCAENAQNSPLCPEAEITGVRLGGANIGTNSTGSAGQPNKRGVQS